MTDRDLTRTYSRTQFVAKLRRLADAIESERPFTIQVAGEKLRIPAEASFNVEHERSGSNQELEFQLLWKRDDASVPSPLPSPKGRGSKKSDMKRMA